MPFPLNPTRRLSVTLSPVWKKSKSCFLFILPAVEGDQHLRNKLAQMEMCRQSTYVWLGSASDLIKSNQTNRSLITCLPDVNLQPKIMMGYLLNHLSLICLKKIKIRSKSYWSNLVLLFSLK